MELTKMQETNASGPRRVRVQNTSNVKRTMRQNTMGKRKHSADGDEDDENFTNELNFTDEELNAGGKLFKKIGAKIKAAKDSKIGNAAKAAALSLKETATQNSASTPEAASSVAGTSTNSKMKWYLIGGGVILLGIISIVIYKIRK
jgi:hypothetical protein